MKRVYHIPDPIYHAPFTIFLGTYHQMQAYCKQRWGMQPTPYCHNKNAERFSVQDTKTQGIIAYVIWLEHFDCLASDYSTLLHECFHQAMTVFDTAGVVVSHQQQEPMAYYLSYIYGESFRALCDEWKQHNKEK